MFPLSLKKSNSNYKINFFNDFEKSFYFDNEYSNLKYDASEIFKNKIEYDRLVMNKVNYLKKGIFDNNLTKFEKTFYYGDDKKEINLTLNTLTIVLEDMALPPEKQNKNLKVTLPIALLPLFYYKGIDTFQKLLVAIVKVENNFEKISFDEKDEDLFSDKESENNESNNNNNDNNIFIITSPQQKKKKNSKASAGTFIKDEIFAKILFAILGEDNKGIVSPIKDDSSAGWKKAEHKKDNLKEKIVDNKPKKNNLKKYPFRTQKSFNMDEPKKFQVNDVQVKKKRSSFMTPFKFNFNKKHVRFTNDKNEINEEDSPRNSDTSKKDLSEQK